MFIESSSSGVVLGCPLLLIFLLFVARDCRRFELPVVLLDRVVMDVMCGAGVKTHREFKVTMSFYSGPICAYHHCRRWFELEDVGMNSELVRLDTQGTVAKLTLNCSAKRNCLSFAMLDELHAKLSELSLTESVRVIILAAEGSAFCAGHDLRELTEARGDADGGRAFFVKTMKRCSSLMQVIVTCPKPVIAAVQGVATAAGCQLVASCDLAIASDAAKFATPGVNIGLFCSTPMVALSRNVARKKAMEMLLTGELIDARSACDWGLVNRVVSPEELNGEVRALAEKIASKSERTIKIGQEAFYRQLEMPLSEAYEFTSHIMVENLFDQDAEEGIEAFLEKRPPKWMESE